MPVEVMKAFEEKFEVRVLEGYGLSETSPLACFNHFERASKPGTVGQAIMGVKVKCVDENDRVLPAGERGEIVIRGTNIMKGYYKRPEATAEAFKNGWFHSGDLAVMQPDGYVKIKDRSKDVIISGGENISSIEVEDALYKHPAVMAAAVVALPDPKWGEVPCAFVELRSDGEATADEIIAHCREHLAGFKVPKKIIFGELPKTSTGKIQKFVLRERAKSTASFE